MPDILDAVQNSDTNQPSPPVTSSLPADTPQKKSEPSVPTTQPDPSPTLPILVEEPAITIPASGKNVPNDPPIPDPTSLPSEPPPPSQRKEPFKGKGILIAVLLFLFVSLPLVVFFVSQQKQIADNRGKAALNEGETEVYAPSSSPGDSNINNQGSQCSDSQPPECNDSGSINFCLHGTWASRAKNAGEPCAPPPTAGPLPPPASIHIGVLPGIDQSAYFGCFANYYASNYKPSDADKICQQAKTDVEKMGIDIGIPDLTNPVTAVGVSQYFYCINKGINEWNQSPNTANDNCKHLITNPENPQLSLPTLNIDPLKPIKNDIGTVEWSYCMAIASKDHDMNLSSADSSCHKFLADPILPEAPNIQTPQFLKDAQYGGCIVNEFIKDRSINKTQAESNCSGVRPTVAEQANGIASNGIGNVMTNCVTQMVKVENMDNQTARVACGLDQAPTEGVATPAPVQKPEIVSFDCSDNKQIACDQFGQSCQNNTCVGPKSSSGSTPSDPKTEASGATRQSQPGQCDSGGQPHVYSECCGSGYARIINRSCQNGEFVWNDDTGCVNKEGACLKPGESQPSAPPPVICSKGQVWYNGICNDISTNGCVPQCAGKACGEPDNCSGVCTEKCATYADAQKASATGPTNGLVNQGKGIQCSNGVCKNITGGRLQICTCSSLKHDGVLTAFCDENCVDVNESQADCQAVANNTCKVTQMDVYNGSNGLVDATACVPSNSSCSISSPPSNGGGTGGGGTGGGGTGGGGGGGGTTPTPVPTGIPQCNQLTVYKNGVVVDPSTLQVGDAVTLAIAGAGSSKAHIRVNGSDWTESTTKNSSGEFTVSYTIPSGITNFTIEGEVFQDGAWH